jgi:hypothetical protein
VHATLLSEFDRAIAFDRKGQDSVITHQGWGRCCSDNFAEALAAALCTDNMWFAPDDTGVYTDTAEFTEIIPECTNISVGYEGAHSERESLDLLFFNQLADQVLMVNWDNMPTERDPSVVETLSYGDGYSYGNYNWDFGKSQWDAGYKPVGKPPRSMIYDLEAEMMDAIDDARRGVYKPLMDMISEVASPHDPSIARKTMSRQALEDEELLNWAEDAVDQGYDIDSILDELYQYAAVH